MVIKFEYDSDESTPEKAVEKLLADFRAGDELYFAVSAAETGDVEIVAATIRGVTE